VTAASHARAARVALVAILAVAFALAAHAAIAGDAPPRMGAALSLVPLLVLGAFAVRRSNRTWAGYAVGLVAIGALWLGWSALERRFADLFFLEHAGGNLALAIVFGHTLAAGREPLCTRFARALRGDLPPDVAGYTRRLTAAWTAFFVVMFTLSCALYLGGFVAQWSFFANIVTPLLVAAMFLVEYAIRVRTFPSADRVGILGGIRAFSRHFH
jgi:uncharacterized membrane protein